MSNSTTANKVKSTAKNSAKKGKSAPKKSATTTAKGTTAAKKTERVVFLVDGMTGKQFQNNKIETNRAVKTEIRSFSFAKKCSIENDMGFYSSIRKFNENDLSPANLLPLRTAKEKAQIKTAFLHGCSCL